jgi:hypothetical protein
MNLEGFQCCEHVVNAVNAVVYLVFYDLLKCVCFQIYLEFIECSDMCYMPYYMLYVKLLECQMPCSSSGL